MSINNWIINFINHQHDLIQIFYLFQISIYKFQRIYINLNSHIHQQYKISIYHWLTQPIHIFFLLFFFISFQPFFLIEICKWLNSSFHFPSPHFSSHFLLLFSSLQTFSLSFFSLKFSFFSFFLPLSIFLHFSQSPSLSSLISIFPSLYFSLSSQVNSLSFCSLLLSSSLSLSFSFVLG